jgi:8-oxo-dGTP pyrophosphatase MutT (NUDIX family)
MKRHFTATGFVVDGARTLLHWHKRLQQWMPPGGHIELDEDPVQAVLREVQEETGLVVEVIPIQQTAGFRYPEQLPPPYTILIEDIPGPGEPHKHIDMIYFCRLLNGATGLLAADQTLRWVSKDELKGAEALDVAGCGVTARVPDDVRELALIAIKVARQMEEIRPKL